MAQRPNTLRPELGGWHLWGARLRRLRECSPFRSCSDLARAVNCDPSLISKYENATRRPHVDQVKLLDAALGADGALVDLHAEMTRHQELSKTAATMAWDSGQHGVAQRYYLMAAQAARSAGDQAFFANVVGGMARQLLYVGEPGDALELVHLALGTSEGRLTPQVRSMLHTREAWAYAELGRFSAFERATGRAEEALVADATEPEPHWIEYFDVAELDGTTGGRLLKLAHRDVRHVDAAVRRIERAAGARRPGRLRGSALDQVGLAEAYLLRGDLDDAVHTAHRALDVVARTDSERVRLKLCGLDRLTGSHRGARSVAELRDRMKPFLVVNGRT